MRKRAAATAVALVLVYLVSGCAHDVHSNYPAYAPGNPVGSVTVRLTQESRGVSVTINGVLVAEGKHTEKITVKGVPAGPAEVMVAAGGGANSRLEKRYDVTVQPYADTAVVVAAPEMSTSYAIFSGLYNLGYFIFAGAIYAALL